MMKTNLRPLFCILMGLTIALYGSCEKVEDGKFKFIISDKTKEATVVGCTGTPDVYLTIPSKCIYKGRDYIVTAIDSCAFKSCESIGFVSFPISLKKIGNNAFLNCSNLTSIKFNEAIEDIGACAFMNCSRLESVKCPRYLKSLEESAFYACESLSEVEFNNTLEVIGEHAFDMCTSLSKVKWPENLKKIDKYAFSECYGFEQLVFNDKLETICEGAFVGCPNLTEITLPASLSLIEKEAFADCGSLKKVICTSPTPIKKLDPDLDIFGSYQDNMLMQLEVPMGTEQSYFDAGAPWSYFKTINGQNYREPKVKSNSLILPTSVNMNASVTVPLMPGYAVTKSAAGVTKHVM